METPDIQWVKRYSFTDEPDNLGRWKRHAQVQHADGWPRTIGEVSKFFDRDKLYCAQMFVPQRNGDNPCDTRYFEQAADAIEFVEQEWHKFFQGITDPFTAYK